MTVIGSFPSNKRETHKENDENDLEMQHNSHNRLSNNSITYIICKHCKQHFPNGYLNQLDPDFRQHNNTNLTKNYLNGQIKNCIDSPNNMSTKLNTPHSNQSHLTQENINEDDENHDFGESKDLDDEEN